MDWRKVRGDHHGWRGGQQGRDHAHAFIYVVTYMQTFIDIHSYLYVCVVVSRFVRGYTGYLYLFMTRYQGLYRVYGIGEESLGMDNRHMKIHATNWEAGILQECRGWSLSG